MVKRARADAVTELILEVFRLNGRLIAAGDALVAPIGLTSARWQVLGAVALVDAPATVSNLARAMGLARQSVQRIVNELVDAGVLLLADNPNHKRARQVAFTPRGQAMYAAAAARQGPWARALSGHLDLTAIEQAIGLLRAVRAQLEADSIEGADP
jgi:DNA-binding MarR family transcriptional regulator